MSSKHLATVADVEPPEDLEANEKPDTDLVGRMGLFLLASSEQFKPPHSKTLEAVADALEEDPRVIAVKQPKQIEDSWCGRPRIYPSPAENGGLISGSDILQTLHFSRPLSFSITVPAKNQPLRSDDDVVPTDYRVIWDGMLALVLWHAPGAKRLPLSGGHVVADILNNALEKLGYRLYIQGCNPGCTHKFSHTDMRFSQDLEDDEEVEYVGGKHFAEVKARVPSMEVEDLAHYVFYDLHGTVRDFMELKNFGRRILELEADGRTKLSSLMRINYTRANLPAESFVDRLKTRWGMRGWLRKSRFLIARVWLTLSNIELLRREWETSRFDFESSADERGKRKLFEQDYADEVDRVQSLDPELMRSGVQEMAERLDSRALLRVTATAAIAGAIAGGVVGVVANGL